MIRRPPRSTRTDSPFPYTPLFRSGAFLRQRLGEAVDARFGGGIVDLAVLASLPVDRADVDDAAPAALDHAAKGRSRHVEAAAEVDAHVIVTIVVAHTRQRDVAGRSEENTSELQSLMRR